MKCNNCESNDFHSLPQTRCNWYKIPLTAVKCKNCGLVFLNPRPDKTLGMKYMDDAYSNAAGFESHDYYRDHDQIFSRNKVRFEIIKKINSPNNKILDFGAGQGHFVKVCLDNNLEASGVELSVEAIKSAQELFQIKLLDSIDNLPKNYYGIITLWDVIEHLEDPKEILIKLSTLLASDGYLVIETSNINSFDYLINNKNWVYWHVDHFFYYSNITLKYLLDKLGFELVNVQSNSYVRLSPLAKIIRKIKKLMIIKDIIKNIKLFYFMLTTRNVSNTSLMTLVARKK